MDHLPVHWHEGLFIRPHHFQAAEHYRDERSWLVDQCYHPYNYGIRSIEVNEDAIGNYQFHLLSCLARTRDGTVVSFRQRQGPSRIDTKACLHAASQSMENIDDALASETSAMVYLAVPKLQDGPANVSRSGTEGDERYATQLTKTAEESQGGGVQEIEQLALNYRLVATTREPSGYEFLEVARIKRAGEETSHPRIDDSYIPPLLSIDAWPRLYSELEGLYHYIGENVDMLSRQIISRGITLASQEPGDLDRIFKLRTLNEAYAALRSMIFATGVHPYQAYCELCRYVGMLAIFGEERRVPDCPLYDHDDLGRIFPKVIQRIKELVESGGKWEYEMRYFKGIGRILQVTLDRKWLNPDWTWYVGVNPSGLSEQSCQSLLGSESIFSDERTGPATGSLDWKISSASEVENRFVQRRPGLTLLPQRDIPRALPAGRGWIYYSVSREGNAWSAVQAEGTLGLCFNERLIQNLATLQGQQELEVVWRGRPVSLQFALFAVPRKSA